MVLLAGVFLRDLQFDGFVRFFEAAEQRRNRFARLEVDWAIFNLDDDVVRKFAVERMKNVVGSFGPVILGIVPIKMVVIDKRPVENDPAMRRKRVRDHVGCLCGRPAVGRGTGPALGIRFYDKSAEIGNLLVNLVNFLAPPFGNARIQRIKRIQATDPFGAA